MDERRSLPTSHTKDELDHLRSLPTSHERDERRSLSPSSDEEDERTDELWELVINDRLGRKVRVKCSPYDTINDLKALTAAQIGTNAKRLIFKLGQYGEVRHVPGRRILDVLINGQNIELFYL